MNIYRIIFLVGIIAPWLAIGHYFYQVNQSRLDLPVWFGLACYGAPCLALFATIRKFSMWKFFGLGFSLIPIAVGTMLMFGLGVSAYEGPAAVDKPLPEFQVENSDGKTIDRKGFVASGPQLLIAFRGSW